MSGSNRDIDRRHSIAIACPFVSRSNPTDVKRRGLYGVDGTALIIFSAGGFRASLAPRSRIAPPVSKILSNQQVCSHALAKLQRKQAAPEKVIAFTLLERNPPGKNNTTYNIQHTTHHIGVLIPGPLRRRTRRRERSEVRAAKRRSRTPSMQSAASTWA
jgi:hypothetical protein